MLIHGNAIFDDLYCIAVSTISNVVVSSIYAIRNTA